MYQSSVFRKIFLSNSFKRNLSVFSLLSLLLSSLLGTHQSIALGDEITAPETASEPQPPVLIQPVRSTPETTPINAPRLVIPQNHNTTLPTLAPRQTAEGKNNFIDTRNYTPPSTVIVTERRSGCQTIAQNGQLVSGRCAVTNNVPRQRVARVSKPLPPVNLVAVRPSRHLVRQTAPIAIQTRRQPVIANNPVRRYAPTFVASANPVRLAPPSVIYSNVVPLNSPQGTRMKLALAPLSHSKAETSIAPPTYERATRLSPTVNEQPQHTDLLFPLAIPAQITSVFGWRQHPIAGNNTLHAGTDIGAPLGTPVLAAYAGQVDTADWVGGYGLMVILRHLDGSQESRYAHLSEIYVKPGEWVEQGAVIGRVGSTGLSTGPHLHFEWRHQTEEGWTAVDAGLHLEYALDNLLQKMQMATSNNPDQG